MKKTQRKDAIRNIRKKNVSWISIVIVTMLTVGVFMGCRFFNMSTERDGTAYYKKHNFKDIDVISKTGLLTTELETLRGIDGVVDVEGFHQLDVTASLNGANVFVPLIRKTERISTPELLQGNLPEKKGEIAVSLSLAQNYAVKVGDRVYLYAEGGQDKLIAGNQYQVTGIVNHPDYMQVIKSDFLLASDESFVTEEIGGGYLRALVRVEYPDDLNIFSQKYFDTIHPVEERIKEVFPEMIVTHKEELWALAEQKIQDETAGPRQKLEEAEAKLLDGERQLAEGKEKLNKSKKELEDGEKQLEESAKKLEDGEKQLDIGEKELAENEKKLEEGKAEYDRKKEEAEQKIADAKNKLNKAESEANAGLEKIDSLEKTVKNIGSALGISDLPAGYYSLKNQAEEFYAPAMEAAVDQKDNQVLLDEAKRKTDAAIAGSLSGKESLADVVGDRNLGDVLDRAGELYGDMLASRFVQQLEEIVKSGNLQVEQIKGLIRETIGAITVAQLVETLRQDERFSDALKTKLVDIIDTAKTKFSELINGYGKAAAAKKAVSGARDKLASEEEKARQQLAEAEQKLSDGERQLEEGRKKLEDGKAEYEKGLAEYDAGKERYEKGKKEYEDGLAKYNEKKKLIDDSRKKYQDSKDELEKRIAEEREKIEEKLDGYFAIQNRRANAGYVNLRTNINTIGMASWAFIVLFLIVSAMVTFSTIVIIMDEQRSLAGAMKALGFFNRDIRAKYSVFGLSAAIAGIILGIVVGIGVETLFRYGIAVMYVFGRPSFLFTAFPIVLSSLLVILVVIAAIHVSTHGMLKLSAIQLMSGYKKEKTLKGRDEGSKGGIYGKLILRNMRTESARVSITTLIIAVSCGLIGVGFNLKNAFGGMTDQEVEHVWNYDIKLTFKQNTDEETRERLEQVMKEAGVSFVPMAEIGTIYQDRDLQEYTYIQVFDQEIVGEYYHVKDWKTGEEMTIPDDGVLIQSRLHETRNLKAGDTYTLYDHKLKEHTVTVKGVYTNYVGRAVIMSRHGYKELFGTDAIDNAYLVHLNGASKAPLMVKLKAIEPSLTSDSAEELQNQYKQIRDSYNTVVYLLTGMAIFMSVFVLANLTNIFVSRRRKELIIMRVNGFSTKQCIGYLIRETLTTAILGFIFAVILGGLISRMLVGMIEQPDTMLDRAFQPGSWVTAIILEAIFASTINFFVFRKVRKLKVTDITA